MKLAYDISKMANDLFFSSMIEQKIAWFSQDLIARWHCIQIPLITLDEQGRNRAWLIDLIGEDD